PPGPEEPVAAPLALDGSIPPHPTVPVSGCGPFRCGPSAVWPCRSLSVTFTSGPLLSSPPPFWLQQAPPSLRLRLLHQSLQLALWPLDPYLHLWRSSLLLSLYLLWLSVCTVGSTYITAVASSRPMVAHALAPPSIDINMEHNSGCGLGTFHHPPSPPWTLFVILFLVVHPPPEPPPVSSAD
ncbi:hypothetical protein M9458_041816, partial [Cirrhinus mrigala]